MSGNRNKLSPEITPKSKKEQKNKSYIFKLFESNFVPNYLLGECMFYKARKKKNEFCIQICRTLDIREMKNFVGKNILNTIDRRSRLIYPPPACIYDTDTA